MDLVRYDGSLLILIRKPSVLRSLGLRFAPVIHSVILCDVLLYCIVLYCIVLSCIVAHCHRVQTHFQLIIIIIISYFEVISHITKKFCLIQELGRNIPGKALGDESGNI